MTPRPATAAAMRQAIDHRLRSEANRRGTTFEVLRTKLMLERLLARLFAEKEPPWLLKGGVAFELRYRPRARATVDLDLAILPARFAATRASDILTEVRRALRRAATIDLADFLQFDVGPARKQLQGPPQGGAAYPVTVRLADREFGRFHVDVALGDAVIGEPEELIGDDLLAFAGIAPARALAISRAQQFAEKLHAYTHPWSDRESTRVKDLVDLVLLIERGSLEKRAVREAVEATFATRARHAVPREVAPPPEKWVDRYPALAAEAGLAADDVKTAFELMTAYWRAVVE